MYDRWSVPSYVCPHVGATIADCRWRGQTPRLGKVTTADHRLVTKYLRFVWLDEPNASGVVSCFRTWQRLSLNLHMSRPFTRLQAICILKIVLMASIDYSFQVNLNISFYHPHQNTTDLYTLKCINSLEPSTLFSYQNVLLFVRSKTTKRVFWKWLSQKLIH